MIDPTTMVPSANDAPLEIFDETSRYRGLPLVTCVDGDGRTVVYVGRRFLPPPAALAEVALVEVREGDRLDTIAMAQFGDPRWWWRIADANGAIDPADLTARLRRTLRITLPAGMPMPRQG